MLVLSHSEVESLLDLDRLVVAVEEAMAEFSAGRVSMPPRIAAVVPDRQGVLMAMPSFLPSAGALTTKMVTVFPDNTDRPTHGAVICCFDPADGAPLAVMDGSYVTAARTAAGSVVATKVLARPDAGVVGIIGTGVQARVHIRAFARLAGVRVIRVAGRNPTRAKLLVDEFAAGGVPVEVAASIEECVRSAGIVCATTHADDPVVRREWLQAGTHINSVGYNPAGEGEVDAATIRDSVVAVESREAALAPPPAGAVEIRRAIDGGIITSDHILAEVGELVAGRGVGRTDPAQLTLYKSVGVAVEDAAAAALVLEAARQRGAGTSVEI